MSKQLIEIVHSEDDNNTSECVVKKAHFNTLNNKKAIQYLTRELNTLFVQREKPIEKAFAHFQDTLSNLFFLMC